MDHKIIPQSQISPVPPAADRLTPDVEVWDPPFERWIRLADTLLGRAAARPPKAGLPRDAKTLKH